MTTCKNCSVTFDGKFCPNCSQKASTHRFTLGHFAHDLWHGVTHTDKGILFLIKKLFRYPGKVALEYNAGKRKRYFNPITFLLVMLALQYFVMKKTDMTSAFINATQEFVSNMAKKSNKVREEELRKQLDEARLKSAKTLENNKLVSALSIPFIALLTWLFFRKSGYNYAENLVLHVLIMGQSIVLFILVCVIPYLIYPDVVFLAYYLNILVLWIYSFIAYKQFFEQGWGKTIFKGILIQAAYMAWVVQISNFAFRFL